MTNQEIDREIIITLHNPIEYIINRDGEFDKDIYWIKSKYILLYFKDLVDEGVVAGDEIFQLDWEQASNTLLTNKDKILWLISVLKEKGEIISDLLAKVRSKDHKFPNRESIYRFIRAATYFENALNVFASVYRVERVSETLPENLTIRDLSPEELNSLNSAVKVQNFWAAIEKGTPVFKDLYKKKLRDFKDAKEEISWITEIANFNRDKILTFLKAKEGNAIHPDSYYLLGKYSSFLIGARLSLLVKRAKKDLFNNQYPLAKIFNYKCQDLIVLVLNCLAENNYCDPKPTFKWLKPSNKGGGLQLLALYEELQRKGYLTNLKKELAVEFINDQFKTSFTARTFRGKLPVEYDGIFSFIPTPEELFEELEEMDLA